MIKKLTQFATSKTLRLLAIVLFLTNAATAQFLDLNLLNPKITAEASYYAPSGGFINHTQRSERIGLQFPIKSKFSLGVKLGELLTSGSIKNALKKVKPKAYQIMGNVDLNHLIYRNDLTPGSSYVDLAGAKVGFTGFHVWYKNKKPGSFIWNVNATFMEDARNLNRIIPSVSGTFGVGGLIKTKAIWFAGVYINYYNRLLATPVLVINGRFNKHWKYSIIAPKEVSLGYKHNKTWKQDLVFGIDGSQFRSPLEIGPESATTIQFARSFYLKASTQTKLKLGKKVHWYLEAGYFFDGGFSYWEEALNMFETERLSGGLFARTKITFDIGKSLLKSGNLNIDL